MYTIAFSGKLFKPYFPGRPFLHAIYTAPERYSDSMFPDFRAMVSMALRKTWSLAPAVVPGTGNPGLDKVVQAGGGSGFHAGLGLLSQAVAAPFPFR